MGAFQIVSTISKLRFKYIRHKNSERVFNPYLQRLTGLKTLCAEITIWNEPD